VGRPSKTSSPMAVPIQVPRAPRIFLSSTHDDLSTERVVVTQALRLAGMGVVRSEDFTPPGTQPAWDVCRAQVESCDGMVLLLGDEYGSHLGDSGLSYTRGEYEVARAKPIPVFVFAKRGVAPTGRYANFVAQVQAALLWSKEFDGPADLAEAVERQFTGWTPARRDGRPRFTRDRAPIIEDPLKYAVGHVRARVLREHPFLVVFVDTFSAKAEALSLDPPRRLLQSLLAARRLAEEASVSGRLFQELVTYAAGFDELMRARLDRARQRGDVIVCVVDGSDDYPTVRSFHPRSGRLVAFRPLNVTEDADARADVQRTWVDADLDGLLAANINAYVMRCLDEHLIARC
jgi:hypothetical protein